MENFEPFEFRENSEVEMSPRPNDIKYTRNDHKDVHFSLTGLSLEKMRINSTPFECF